MMKSICLQINYAQQQMSLVKGTKMLLCIFDAPIKAFTVGSFSLHTMLMAFPAYTILLIFDMTTHFDMQV